MTKVIMNVRWALHDLGSPARLNIGQIDKIFNRDLGAIRRSIAKPIKSFPSGPIPWEAVRVPCPTTDQPPHVGNANGASPLECVSRSLAPC